MADPGSEGGFSLDKYLKPAPAATATTTSTKNPSDFWNLNNVYGEPVVWGYQDSVVAPVSPNGQDLVPGKTNIEKSPQLIVKHTQDVMKWAADLWKQQGKDREHNGGTSSEFELLQQSLADGNFYGKSDYAKGRWDSQTQAALKKALSEYESYLHSTHDPMKFLDYIKQNTNANPTGSNAITSSSSGPVGPSLTDPASLMNYANTAAQRALGHNLSQDQLNAFVAEFHNQEASQSLNQQTGQAYTNLDPSTQAINFAAAQNPDEYKRHEAQGYTNAFLNLFLPTEDSAPNTEIAPEAQI